MLKEFKEFAMRGNVLDLAVGVIIGGAFGKIVSSFVSDIIMPPIGLALGKVDFSSLYINLSQASYSSLSEAKKAGAPTINYGSFLNTLIDFAIISFAIFLVIRMINKIKTNPANQEITTKTCPECLSSIPLAAKRCSACTQPLV